MADRKLSRRAKEVLAHIAAGRPANHGCRGRSAYGGLSTILSSLVHAGLIDNMYDQRITEAGRAAMLAAAAAPEVSDG